MKKRLTIIFGSLAALLGVVVIAVGIELFITSGSGIDPENPPRIITHNLVAPADLTEVSKFRSGAGHEFAGRGETCSSMKHYFTATSDLTVLLDPQNGQHGVPNGKDDVTIYMPFDGMITSIEFNSVGGYTVEMVPSANQGTLLQLDHVYIDDGFHGAPIPFFPLFGSEVKAGEPIARIEKNSSFDVALRAGVGPWNDSWISYFAATTDEAFAEWTAVNPAVRSDYILTKAYRDQHPLECQDSDTAGLLGKTRAFVVPSVATDEAEFVILRPDVWSHFDEIVNAASMNGGNSSPGQGSGQSANSGPSSAVCDEAHLGSTQESGQGTQVCQVAADGRVVWGPAQ